MTIEEQVVPFRCEGDELLGVLSSAPGRAARGVLIVVGGPQYRVGSHRQFTLLARELAEQGVPVLRFDYRGMGDSAGAARTFERVDADIRRAIDVFFERVPGMRDVVIWGLCDAASAALFYAHADTRVSGLVLVNPWVHSEQGAARVHLRHYYLQRLFQSSLWAKILAGEFSFRRAAAALWRIVGEASGRRPAGGVQPDADGRGSEEGAAEPFQQRMEEGMRRFRGRVLLILSGKDFTAQEFKDLVAGSSRWQRMLAGTGVTVHALAEANHTFARRVWRDQVAHWTATWIKSW
jgi:exosortase A-associated hydrolase 1